MSFLASQFGLNKLPAALRKVIGYVPDKIENALRKGLQAFAKRTGGGTAVKEKNSSLTTNKTAGGAATDEFTYGGTPYRLVVSAESAGGTVIKIVYKADGKLVGRPLRAADFTTADARREFRELVAKADELRSKARKPLAGQPKPTFAYLKGLQADVNKERGDLLNENYIGKCVYLGSGCFSAGTMLAVEGGYKAIEDIRAGERVLSRDQWDEQGEIVAKIVEEVFKRYAGVLHLHAGGQVIRTTHEHPFFVLGKGWTPANQLHVGDRLVCAANGKTVTVESVTDTGEWELVYNLRVAEYHTYFVGDDDWGWAAWAHNAYNADQRLKFKRHAVRLIQTLPTPSNGEKRIDNVEKWVTNKWNRDGSMHQDPMREERFALSVATSLKLAGADEAQIRGLLEVICQFPQPHIARGLENAFREDISRQKAVGNTPNRSSETGLAVRARMAGEVNHDYNPTRDVAHPTNKMAYQAADGQWWVFSKKPRTSNPNVPNTGYVEWEKCEMGHKLDAVVFWNDGDPAFEGGTKGKDFPREVGGGPGPKVRAWMTNPVNYQLQLKSHNASAGGGLWAKGYYWVSPGSS